MYMLGKDIHHTAYTPTAPMVPCARWGFKPAGVNPEIAVVATKLQAAGGASYSDPFL